MKKNMDQLKLTAIFVFIILLSSCEQETLTSEDLTNQIEIDAGDVSFYYSQGILRFNSFDDFVSTANFLNSAGFDYQYDLFKEIGFRSQEMILNEVSSAEDVFDSQYYEGIDENISVQELVEMGFGIEHSPLFNSVVDQGLIAVLCEEDGSESYYPNVLNPALMPVLSEGGFVIVNDTLMQYTHNKIKIAPYTSMSRIDELKESTGADSEKSISVIEFNNDFKSAGHYTHIDKVVTKTKGSNLRVSSRYALWDGNVNGNPFTHAPAKYMYINHIIELKAEEKRWGKWKIRNNYTPLCGLESSWTTCMEFGPSTVCDFTQSGAGIHQSPYNQNPFSSGCTNYYKFYPVPIGFVGYNNEYYNGIVYATWSLIVSAANISDPNNSGTQY